MILAGAKVEKLEENPGVLDEAAEKILNSVILSQDRAALKAAALHSHLDPEL